MTALAQKKCLNHGLREAVARCPVCTSYFCRECIAEHEGLVLCAQCLAKSAAASRQKNSLWQSILVPPGALLGFCLAWLFFLSMGKILIRIPASFHDGSWSDEAGETSEPSP